MELYKLALIKQQRKEESNSDSFCLVGFQITFSLKQQYSCDVVV